MFPIIQYPAETDTAKRSLDPSMANANINAQVYRCMLRNKKAPMSAFPQMEETRYPNPAITDVVQIKHKKWGGKYSCHMCQNNFCPVSQL